MPKQVQTDPYAPPPLKKDKTGSLVRGVIVVGLLALGGAVAYSVMQAPAPQTAALEDQQAPQQLADSGVTANTPAAVTAPEAAPAPTPAPARRATNSRRSAAPRESAPPVAEPTPAPQAPMATPVTPLPAQPLPPPDVSPSTSGQ